LTTTINTVQFNICLATYDVLRLSYPVVKVHKNVTVALSNHLLRSMAELSVVANDVVCFMPNKQQWRIHC